MYACNFHAIKIKCLSFITLICLYLCFLLISLFGMSQAKYDKMECKTKIKDGRITLIGVSANKQGEIRDRSRLKI